MRKAIIQDFSYPQIVIPAQAGIHSTAGAGPTMDSRFRGNDAVGFAVVQVQGI
jgi:hypothetical protein